MKKSRIFNFAAIFFTALFSFIVTLLLALCVKEPAAAIETEGVTGTDGAPISAFCISDLGRLNVIKRVNHTPGEYLIPQSDISGRITETDGQSESSKGTYVFVIANLDPWDENFSEKAEALDPYLQGDNYWHFTLYLPACFSACNVYVRSTLYQTAGELSDYDYIKYSASNYQKETLYHKSTTEPMFIDLGFYTRRQAIAGDFLERSIVVTIHYEAEDGRSAGFASHPLIGLDSVVRSNVGRDKNLLGPLSLISALVLAVFLFVCFLKRTVAFIPQVSIIAGTLLFFLSRSFLLGSTALPFFWLSMSAFSAQFVALSAICALRLKIKNFPLWHPFAVFAGINCILVFIPPYVSAAAVGVGIYLKAANLLLAAVICVFALLRAGTESGESPFVFVSPVLTAALLIVSVCLQPTVLFIAAPAVWLHTAILTFTVFLGLGYFIRMEKRNVFLTDNLQSEVERQTNGLKSVIDERDKLLRYLSHDLKKPVRSMERFLDTLRAREENPEQVKTIDIIKQKASEIDESLTELQKYERFNYAVERSESFDAGDAIQEIYERLAPDCEANDVKLTCIPAHVSVFAKRNTLLSIVGNLVFNALEHSECGEIRLTIGKRKRSCLVVVADDGKGISSDADIFRPYYSGVETEENLGLGLYICKQSALSMGGDLTLDQSAGKTAFILTLPLS